MKEELDVDVNLGIRLPVDDVLSKSETYLVLIKSMYQEA
jgi:hypothetical protein